MEGMLVIVAKGEKSRIKTSLSKGDQINLLLSTLSNLIMEEMEDEKEQK